MLVVVLMMGVRIVWVLMAHGLVTMPVHVGPFRYHVVMVIVMFVMNMHMSMLHRFMRMFMVMDLGQMQPDPKPHQQARDQ